MAKKGRHKEFDEFLDANYPQAVIEGWAFYPSRVLFECDREAYFLELHLWLADRAINEA